VPRAWVWLDIGLAAVFTIEFFTPQRLSLAPRQLPSHPVFLISFAIVPALALVNQGFAIEGAWVWLILVAAIRPG